MSETTSASSLVQEETPDSIRKARIFVGWGFLPHFGLVVFITLGTLLKWFRLWPQDHDIKLLLVSICFIVVLLLTLLFVFLRHHMSILLYVAGVVQMAILFFVIHYTGGIQGSPFSFYYLYIPSVVGITFVTKHSKGLFAASFTAFGCFVCVMLHIFIFTADWSPVATITSDQLETIKVLCSSRSPVDTSYATRIADICATAKPLTANDL